MPRGRPRIHDQDQLLDAAMTVLWREGVRGISLNRLSEETGVSKPVIAGAVGCKDELIARALARYGERFGASLSAALSAGDSPESLALGYLLALAEQQTDPETPSGCFLAAANSECARIDSGPVRESLDRLNQASRQELVDALRRVGDRDPDASAQFLFGQGIAMSALARNGATREELERFAKIASRAIKPSRP